jgi:hypothetical protein
LLLSPSAGDFECLPVSGNWPVAGDFGREIKRQGPRTTLPWLKRRYLFTEHIKEYC